MTITIAAIESVAPDQASLKAATKLMKPAIWPVLAEEAEGSLMWAECQGSGANPYRVTVDKNDLGYKCTCPSRKFPCKHALALMWFKAEGKASFQTGTAPEWVMDWVGRRRKTSTPPVKSVDKDNKVSLEAAVAAEAQEAQAPLDPKAEARKAAAAVKRAEQTEASMLAATHELDQWIMDQLRTGLSGFIDNVTDNCRKIAARLVDGKAGALAGRLDEMPSRLLAYPAEIRSELALSELAKLVLLTQSFRAAPKAAELRRLIGTTENRQQILEDTESRKVSSTWELLGEQVITRRDGLVAQYSWLLNLKEDSPQRLALLLDFFHASAGKRGGAVNAGEQFEAELVFYSGKPLRAVIGERGAALETPLAWPLPPQDPLHAFQDMMQAEPWTLSAPVFLPQGRVCKDDAGQQWWRGEALSLPLSGKCDDAVLGMDLQASVGIWDNRSLTLIASQSSWGRVAYDG